MSKKEKEAAARPALLRIKVAPDVVDRLHALLRQAAGEDDPAATLAAIEKLPPRLGPVLAHGFMEGGRAERLAILRFLPQWSEEAMLDVLAYFRAQGVQDMDVRAKVVQALRNGGMDVPEEEVRAVETVLGAEEKVLAFLRSDADPAGPEGGALARELLTLPANLRSALVDKVRAEAGLRGARFLVASGDLALAEAAVEQAVALASQEAADYVTALAEEAESKALRKLAKKALYRLKSRGVAVKEAPPPPSAVWTPPKTTETLGLMSVTDGGGYASVCVFKPIGMGDWGAAQAVVSDEKGLVEIRVFQGPRKPILNFHKELLANSEIPFAPAEPGYVAARIEAARAMTLAQGGEIPAQYAQWRSLRVEPDPNADPARGLEGAGSETLVFARDAERVLDDPCFHSWIVPREDLGDLPERTAALDDSGLVLSDAQKAERRAEMEKEAREAYFTPERRARWAARLRAMAPVLVAKAGEDAARIALHQARALEDGAECPLMEEVFGRSAAYALLLEKKKRSEEKKDSPLVDPEEAARELAARKAADKAKR